MKTSQTSRDTPPFTEVDGGTLNVNLHAGQTKAWRSEKRIVGVISGTQGGKTCFGPVWMHREIKRCGPGHYMVVTPTYPLLQKKALPEFKRHFEQRLGLGRYKQSDKEFVVSSAGEHKLFGSVQEDGDPTKVFFGYADSPESLESATAKAAWLDEAGQSKFKLGSWEAVNRRLALHQGRSLITTTPYNLGWLKQKIYDPWQDSGGDHPDIDVVRFESRQNPAFPREEWERQKGLLPRWKFDLFYRGVFTRPAGQIYDCFDPDEHTLPRFRIRDDWPRYIGVDFGGVNTAALFYAKAPNGNFYLYREYKAGERTAEEHVKAMLEDEPMPERVFGGAKSEGQWRREFRNAGLPIQGPRVKDVEVGIDRVYGLHKQGRVYVFDDLERYLEEKQTYARELDDNDQPTEDIADKHTFHFMDAERYVLSHVGVDGETAGGAALIPM